MAERNDDLLVGIMEISGYLGIGPKKVRELACRDAAFPARNEGVWLSSRRALDEWVYESARRKQ